jgi:hypothetical protein
VIPNSKYSRINLTGASNAQINSWMNADLSMVYSYDSNEQPFKGDGGVFLGLLLWPQNDDATTFLTPAGTRRKINTAGVEIDNPYFNVSKNRLGSKNNRLISNLGVRITPFSWGSIKTNLGSDTYTTQYVASRHPESNYGVSVGGILDQDDNIVRNLNLQNVLNVNSVDLTSKISFTALLGNSVQDNKSVDDAAKGQDFLDPNFVSLNNTNLRTNRQTISQRRLVSAYGSVTLDYNRYA